MAKALYETYLKLAPTGEFAQDAKEGLRASLHVAIGVIYRSFINRVMLSHPNTTPTNQPRSNHGQG
jgi:hypothetical protein